MTFMLDDFDPAKVAPARGRDVQPTQFGEGLSASTSMAMRDTNANFLRQRQVIGERDALAAQAAERLGAEGMRPVVEAYNARVRENGLNRREIDIGMPMSEVARQLGPNGSKEILDAARTAATTAPDAWSDLDLSDEGIEGRVTARRVQDDADEQAILDMMPSGRAAAEFVGGVVGATADVRNAPFVFLGSGGGSFLKVLGREAVWGGVAEAVTLPSQYEVAGELGKADPNAVAAIAFGAVGGAVLGGGIEGISRAARYYQGRGSMPEPLPGLDGADSELIVGAAEAALVRGDDPVLAVQQVIDDAVEFTTDFDLDTIFAASRATAKPDVAIRMQEQPQPFRAPQSETAIPISPDLPRVDTSPAAANAIRYRAARDTDPEAFTALERHQGRANTFRQWLSELGDQQDTDVTTLLSSIDRRENELTTTLATMKTGGRRRVKEQVSRVRAAREEALTLSGRRETADMQRVRRELLAEDQAMRDLGPRLARAYAASRPQTPETNIEAAWRTFSRPQAPGWVPTFPVQRTVMTPARAGAEVQVQPAATVMSETASPQARVIHDTMAADLRDRIEADGDSSFDLEDGRGKRSMSAILDDLDAAEEFNAVLDACGKPRRTA